VKQTKNHSVRVTRPQGQPRTYHIVDVENLCGTGRPTSHEVRRAMSSYARAVAMKEFDQGRAAMSYSQERAHLFDLPRQLRWVVAGTGHDAADDALLGDCDPELLARSFDRVVIATGDHRFAGLAAELRTRGVHITVAGVPGHVAQILAAQADEVVDVVWAGHAELVA